MDIIFKCVNCDASEKVQERLEMNLEKMAKKYPWIKDATVFLKNEPGENNRNNVVEILLGVPGPDMFAKARKETFELAAVEATEGIRRQLKRQKEKTFAHATINPVKE